MQGKSAMPTVKMAMSVVNTATEIHLTPIFTETVTSHGLKKALANALCQPKK